MIPIEFLTYAERVGAGGCFYEVFGVLFWFKSGFIVRRCIISTGISTARCIGYLHYDSSVTSMSDTLLPSHTRFTHSIILLLNSS